MKVPRGEVESEEDSKPGIDRRPSMIHDVCVFSACLLYTSDAADERSSVDLGGRRIIKKKKQQDIAEGRVRLTTRERNHIDKKSRD